MTYLSLDAMLMFSIFSSSNQSLLIFRVKAFREPEDDSKAHGFSVLLYPFQHSVVTEQALNRTRSAVSSSPISLKSISKGRFVKTYLVAEAFVESTRHHALYLADFRRVQFTVYINFRCINLSI